MGSVSPASGSYAAGALIKLTKTANSGYTFDHWGGADSVLMHNDTLVMPAKNATVKAVFKAITVMYYTLPRRPTTTRWGRSHRQAGIMPPMHWSSSPGRPMADMYFRPLGRGGQRFNTYDTLTMPSHNAAVKAVFKAVAVTYYTFIATTTMTQWDRFRRQAVVMPPEH